MEMKKYISTITLHIFALTLLSLCFKTNSSNVIMEKPKDIILFNPKCIVLHKKTKEELEQQCEEELKLNAFDLANKYIDVKGDCYEIATKFIKELKGIKEHQLVEITKDEVLSGDLVFYRNNGFNGLTHWSVVLDLEKDIALHGSLTNGKCGLSKVYMEKMTTPKFYRVIERKK